MKKLLFLGAFIITLALIYTSCAKKSSTISIKGCMDKSACNYYSIATVDDGSCIFQPSGTVTTFLQNDNGDNKCLDFKTGSTTTSCTNFSYWTGDLYFSSYTNFSVCTHLVKGIIDIGVVSCVGGVTTKPVSGYTTTVASILGHGYVVVLQDSTYARIYCDAWELDTNNGIIGVKIEWQYPFN